MWSHCGLNRCQRVSIASEVQAGRPTEQTEGRHHYGKHLSRPQRSLDPVDCVGFIVSTSLYAGDLVTVAFKHCPSVMMLAAPMALSCNPLCSARISASLAHFTASARLLNDFDCDLPSLRTAACHLPLGRLFTVAIVCISVVWRHLQRLSAAEAQRTGNHRVHGHLCKLRKCLIHCADRVVGDERLESHLIADALILLTPRLNIA